VLPRERRHRLRLGARDVDKSDRHGNKGHMDHQDNDHRIDESLRRRYIRVAGKQFPLPRSRKTRITSGATFVVLGMFGFLPVLGFWMIPVGLLILSHDLPSVRRRRRRLEVWWLRRRDRRGDGLSRPREIAD
jgi:Purine-cytosine permease and related proteins